MSNPDSLHPAPETLIAFAAGRLDHAASTPIEDHLSGCPDCCGLLGRLPGDDPLLSRLRRSGPSGLLAAVMHAVPRTRPVPATEPGTLPSLPGYEILSEVGRGGMGVVYRARQPALARLVALKMILHADCATPEQRVRFRLEAELAARIRHPHIVQVYDVGTHEGRPFLAMEWIEGGSLADFLKKQRPTLREAAELIETLARATHAAHRQGVLHRDLKPANVLLNAEVEARGAAPPNEPAPVRIPSAALRSPKITDFGLAKRLDAEEGLTATGVVVGTPEYMAPEQATSAAHGLGPAVDIYALGVILYELLTGRPPFRGETAWETVQQANLCAPVPLRRLRAEVPIDLEVICLSCLAKEPSRRYASALALAEDLRRFLNLQPIHARRSGSAERAWMWARRRPLVAGLVVAVLAVTLLGIAGVVGALLYALAGWEQAETQESAAVKARDEARHLRDTSRRRSAQLTLDQGIALAAQGEVARGLHYMRESLVLAPPEDEHLRRLARINLGSWGSWLHGLHLVLDHSEEIKAVAFSPDGKTLVTGSAAGVAQRWAAATGQPVGAPLRATAWVWTLAYSPDGRIIATAGGTPGGGRDRNCGVQFWDAVSGASTGVPLPHAQRVRCVAYHPDGKTLATASDRHVRLWDVDTGRLLLELPPHADDVYGVAFSPDGRLLAAASSDRTVRVCAARTGAAPQVLRGHTGPVRAVAFHPDGQHLASASLDGTARLWDVATGQGVGEALRHPDAIETLAFTPDGMTLITGCYDGNARLWNLGTGRPWGSSLGHRLRVTALAVSGDGRAIVTGSQDRTARVWEMGRALSRSTGMMQGWHTPPAPAPVPLFETAAYSPDRATVVTASVHGLAQLWEVATGRPIGAPLVHPHPEVRACAFSPDGKTVATACVARGVASGQVRLWDAATGRPCSSWLSHPAEVVALAFSPDGQTLATGDYRFDVRLWDVATGRVRGPAWHQRDIVLSLAFSPDGRTLVAGTANSWHRDPQARLWDVPTGKPRGEPLRHHHWVHFLAFDPNGKALLTGSRDGTARLWDASTGQPLGPPLAHQFEWTCAAFSPDHQTVLTGGLDGVARLWRTADAAPAGAPLMHRSGVQAVAFSIDGRTLLVGCRDGSAWLWDAQTSIRLGPPLGQGSPLCAVGFAADGQTAVTTADNGRTRAWPIPPPLEGSEDAIALWLEVRTGLAMDAPGQAPAPLDPAAWAQRRRQLAESATDLKIARGPLVDEVAWHTAAACEAEHVGGLFAAGWHLDRLTALEPDNWRAWALRGRIRVNAGRLEDASASYRRAEELAPHDALQAWYRHEESVWRVRRRADLAQWYAGRLKPHSDQDR